MTHLTVTIQLFEGTDGDYTTLHRQLVQAAFILMAERDKGNHYAVPRKTYMREGTVHDVTNTVFAAARKTGRKFSFTVRYAAGEEPPPAGIFKSIAEKAQRN